jgi:flagellar biosynthetic protein FliR
MIESMIKSFDILPLGNINVKWGLVEQFISNFSEVFELSFKVAMPVMVTIFIANVTLGFLAKTVPQMNVFVVGMPMKVAIGMVLLTLTAPLFVKTASKIFEITEFEFLELLKHMKW